MWYAHFFTYSSEYGCKNTTLVLQASHHRDHDRNFCSNEEAHEKLTASDSPQSDRLSEWPRITHGMWRFASISALKQEHYPQIMAVQINPVDNPACMQHTVIGEISGTWFRRWRLRPCLSNNSERQSENPFEACSSPMGWTQKEEKWWSLHESNQILLTRIRLPCFSYESIPLHYLQWGHSTSSHFSCSFLSMAPWEKTHP